VHQHVVGLVESWRDSVTVATLDWREKPINPTVEAGHGLAVCVAARQKLDPIYLEFLVVLPNRLSIPLLFPLVIVPPEVLHHRSVVNQNLAVVVGSGR
jgi:hypothetical protein